MKSMKSHVLTIDFCPNQYTESRLQTETLEDDARRKLPPYHTHKCNNFSFSLTSHLLLPLDSLVTDSVPQSIAHRHQYAHRHKKNPVCFAQQPTDQ